MMNDPRFNPISFHLRDPGLSSTSLLSPAGGTEIPPGKHAARASLPSPSFEGRAGNLTHDTSPDVRSVGYSPAVMIVGSITAWALSSIASIAILGLLLGGHVTSDGVVTCLVASGLGCGIMTYLLLIIVHELCEGHTSLAETEGRMRHFAFVDPLTGLASRLLLNERVTSGLVAACRNRTPLTVLFIDLDQFKAVNDTYGHHAGDELLKQTAKRLKSLVRDVDTVSRLGGDEFVLVLPDTGKQGAVKVAEKTCHLLSEPFMIEGQPIRVTPSIGIRVYPGYGEEDCDTLLKGADRAMYRLKNKGGNGYHVDTPNDNTGRGAQLNAAVVECPRTVGGNQRHPSCPPPRGPAGSLNLAAAAQAATS